MTQDQEPSLLNPNQMRLNGVIVEDVPTHLSPGNSSRHSIICTETGIVLLLSLDGVFSYLETRLPTPKEI